MSEVTEHVYFSSLPADMDDNKFAEIFGAYGNILKSNLLPAKEGGQKRAGIISFASVDEAKWIVENLNGNIPQGLSEGVEVRYKNNQANKGKGKGDFSDNGWNAKGGGYGKADNSWQQPVNSWADAGSAWSGGPPQGGAQPNDRVFVADLPSDMDDAKLTEVFGAYGTIKNSRMCGAGKDGKLSAIISFQSQDEATWIVDNLNGNIPQGLQEAVKVSYKTEKAGKGDDFKGKAGPYGKGGYVGGCGDWAMKGDVGMMKGGGKGDCGVRVLLKGIFDSGAMPAGQKLPNNENSLFVGGLPRDTTDIDLYKLFSPFGAVMIDGIRAMPGDDGSPCKGIGFVNYMEPASAQKAIQTLNGTVMPDGRTLKVSQKSVSGGGQKAGKGW